MKAYSITTSHFLLILFFLFSCEDEEFQDQEIRIITTERIDTQTVITNIQDTSIQNLTTTSTRIFSKPNSSSGIDASIVTVSNLDGRVLNINQNSNFNTEELLISSVFPNESELFRILDEATLNSSFCNCDHISTADNSTIQVLPNETLCILDGEYNGTINGLNNNSTNIFVAEGATFNPRSTSNEVFSINSRVFNHGTILLDNPYRFWTNARVYNNGTIETFGGQTQNNIVIAHHYMQLLNNSQNGSVTFHMESEGTSVRNLIDTVKNAGIITNTRNNIAEPSLRYMEVFNTGKIQMSESLLNPIGSLESGVFFVRNMDNFGTINVQDLALMGNSTVNNNCSVIVCKSLVMNGTNSVYNNFDYTYVGRALQMSGTNLTLDLKTDSRFEVRVDGAPSGENINVSGSGIFAFQTDQFVQNKFDNVISSNVDVRIPSELISNLSDNFCVEPDLISNSISWRSFLRFDNIIESIPNNAILDSAFIRLYSFRDIQQTNTNIELQLITEPWLDNNITWNNQPETNSSYTNGEISINQYNNSIKIDITELVQFAKQRGGYGFRIEQSDTVTDNPFICYSSNSQNQLLRPEIFIRYHVNN